MATATSALSSVPTPQVIENPPNARRTMEALRDLGYDSYASILDIIDNSIDAGARQIVVKISEQKGDILLSIEDDGCGMGEELLSEALRLGSDTERESTDLGKFGMGLVTASIGLSRRVEVLTREDGSPLLYGGFDLDDIADQDRFIKELGAANAEQQERFAKPHGTLVSLSKTDRISNRHPSLFANILKKRIGQVFRKFLKAGVVIEVNEQRVEPVDPLMLGDADTELALEMDMEVDGLGKAYIRAVELPDRGGPTNKALGINADSSGFYVVRNNREIMAAETFDFYKKHPEYAHFRAELAFGGELDPAFHTDVKKMVIQPSQSFLDKLKQATMGLITKSQREKKKRAGVERGKMDHSAAEANISHRATLLPKAPGKGLTEPRAPRSTKKAIGEAKPTDGMARLRPHVTSIKTASGLKVAFNEGNFGEAPFYLVKQEGKTIVITYNRDHPFWRELVVYSDETKIIALFDYLVFALANTELLVPEQAEVVKANVNSTLIGLLV
ncbi:MAG: ATP-binding protein [Vicinamibacterales bacterium]